MKGKVFFIGVVVVSIIVSVVYLPSIGPAYSTGLTIQSVEKVQYVRPVSYLLVSDVASGFYVRGVVIDVGEGYVTVDVYLTNNSSRLFFSVDVSVELLDDEGNLISSASDTYYFIWPGEATYVTFNLTNVDIKDVKTVKAEGEVIL